MTKLTRDQVLKLANLSRLQLSEEEIEVFSHELSEILAYVETLNQTNTDGLKPTYQVTGLKNIMRKDELVDYQAKPDDLIGTQATEEKQYKVKRVID